MTDANKLKELAERCLSPAGGSSARECANLDALRRVAFMKEANPQAILGLIQELEENEGVINVWRGRTQRAEAEVERLRGQVDHLINQHMPREPIPDMPGWTRVIDADRLKAENDLLRSGMKGDYDLDAWLDWAQEKGRLISRIEGLERIINGRWRQIEIERDQLKAENEDYKFGQERYEQLIGAFKAENEALKSRVDDLENQLTEALEALDGE